MTEDKKDLRNILNSHLEYMFREYEGETSHLIDDIAEEIEEHQSNCWQPIETAPKDVYRLLLYNVFTGIVVGCFWTLKGHTNGGEWVGYDCAKGGHYSFHESSQPTHWMPLPPTPQEQTSTQDQPND